MRRSARSCHVGRPDRKSCRARPFCRTVGRSRSRQRAGAGEKPPCPRPSTAERPVEQDASSFPRPGAPEHARTVKLAPRTSAGWRGSRGNPLSPAGRRRARCGSAERPENRRLRHDDVRTIGRNARVARRTRITMASRAHGNHGEEECLHSRPRRRSGRERRGLTCPRRRSEVGDPRVEGRGIQVASARSDASCSDSVDTIRRRWRRSHRARGMSPRCRHRARLPHTIDNVDSTPASLSGLRMM